MRVEGACAQREQVHIRKTYTLSNVTDLDWPERADITRPDAIALLTDLRGLRMLSPFLARTHTLTSAARALGRSPSTLAHWVPRFVEAGLLERHGEIQRAGAPMPRYRAPARLLVVPFGLIPFDARVSLLDEGRLAVLRSFFDGLDESLAESPDTGLSFAAFGDSGSVIDLVEPDADRGRRSYTDGWVTLDLDPDDALALAQELEALLRRYSTRNGRRRFVAHAGIAPEPRFRWRSANDGHRPR
jgi:hypothetical protein